MKGILTYRMAVEDSAPADRIRAYDGDDVVTLTREMRDEECSDPDRGVLAGVVYGYADRDEGLVTVYEVRYDETIPQSHPEWWTVEVGEVVL